MEVSCSSLDHQQVQNVDDNGKPKRTGPKMATFCAIAQYASLYGLTVGYTITAAISLRAALKAFCFHMKGHDAPCQYASNPYMIAMGILEVFLSQIPSFHELTWLSGLAAVMSIGYSAIGTALSFAKIVSEQSDEEGQLGGVSATTLFYLMCDCFGYAAFGNEAPGNMLTGFGFYEPFWLVALGNIFIVVHLVGAYQVFSQPIVGAVETLARRKFPESKLVMAEYPLKFGNKEFNINFLRIVWRTVFVAVATLLSMAFPFFNAILSLLRAIGFWPCTVFLPIQMHVVQKKIRRESIKWIGLQLLNLLCLLVAVAAAVSSIEGFSSALQTYKPFKTIG
ncbi:Amino acid transporter, transmembrane domain [Dillenia turbinata]|uniref:Amino acid transporter, transmembrane domain n=1 Tax=Dillenia turbinata TaxID=194707 RepID=A0AAN8UMD4_9MAGN